jgi:uncharacterized membrane-anchored protein YhcB (DUF1043 family)
MVKKSEGRKEEQKEEQAEKKDMSRIWADSYSAIAKSWEDSYINVYRPWIESTEKLIEKSVDLSKDVSAEKYKEFFDEWVNMYQNTSGRFYPIMMWKYDRETLEKFMKSSKESSQLFKSWAEELEENSHKTEEMLTSSNDPEKYREIHNMWMKSYEKIYDQLLMIPTMESTRDIFESYSGIPNVYFRNCAQMSKLWKNSYMDLYTPMADSMLKLSGKMTEIIRGEASSETYRDFYNLWMNTYQETYGRIFNIQSLKPSKEMLENFFQSTNVYLNMYKSWMEVLEKMSEKTRELSKHTNDPEAYQEFYNTWLKMYEKAFEDFFENMPLIDPMKKAMEPVKNVSRIYTDSFLNMSNMWLRGFPANRV